MFVRDIINFSIENNFAIRFDENDKESYRVFKAILNENDTMMPRFEELYTPFFLKISESEAGREIEFTKKVFNQLYYKVDFLTNCSIDDFLKSLPSENNTYLDKYNEEKEKNKSMKILDVYKSKEEDRIDMEYDLKIVQVQKEDEIQKVLADAKEKIGNILKSENRELDISLPTLYTENTNKKVYDLLQDKQTELRELRHTCNEVDALLDIATTYDEKMEILQNYDIIDKKSGKMK